MSRREWSYDRIADVYAADMGRSMAFDDVDWFRRQCHRHRGRVLELGCGTGRVMLPLLADGIDIIGIDRSLPMLRRLRVEARSLGLEPRVAQMDLQGLALGASFALILAPYSLVTYLPGRDDLDQWVASVAPLLAGGGALVLDAFVPRAIRAGEDFQPDYARPFGDGMLERAKRVQALADGRNRIERRYRLIDASGSVREEFTTVDCIRPRTPAELVGALERAGLRIEEAAWDYGTGTSAESAQFHTVVGVKA
ncbi:MAG TPA: class I SAM-dependent methyltransferase [Thermomonas sp.]|nr:class I SAM-dependent methyltransferase [Thermomonas sp.]